MKDKKIIKVGKKQRKVEETEIIRKDNRATFISYQIITKIFRFSHRISNKHFHHRPMRFTHSQFIQFITRDYFSSFFTGSDGETPEQTVYNWSKYYFSFFVCCLLHNIGKFVREKKLWIWNFHFYHLHLGKLETFHFEIRGVNSVNIFKFQKLLF